MKFSRKEFIKGSLLILSTISLKANATSKAKHSPDSNILNFGAKADGVSDDSKAVREALLEHSECYIPKTKNSFILGDIKVDSSRVYGLGKIRKKEGSKSIFQIMGNSSQISGLEFVSGDAYTNGMADIRLMESAKNIKILDCNFKSNIYSAITADQNGKSDQSLTYSKPAEDIIISSCIFSGKYSRPIYLHSVSNITISNNIIKNSLFDGIRLRQKVGKCIISNNHFSNIGTKKSDDTQDAIDTYWSGHELIISNNIIDGCAKHGIDIKGHEPNSNYGSNKVIIENNIIKNSMYCGISLSAGKKGKQKKFISIHSIVISNNIIEKSNRIKLPAGNAGIFIRHGVKNITINSNQIINNLCRGIYITNQELKAQANESIIISENQCVNNGYEGDGYGILVSSVNGVIIRGNICENKSKSDQQQVGIAVINDTKRGFSKTTGIIKDNICRKNLKAQIIVPPEYKELIIKDNLSS